MLHFVSTKHMSSCFFFNNTNLWHWILGHQNYKTLSKIASAGVVRGLPTLGKKSLGVCGPCQFGK